MLFVKIPVILSKSCVILYNSPIPRLNPPYPYLRPHTRTPLDRHCSISRCRVFTRWGSALCAPHAVCSLLLPFSCTANTSSSWKIPVARQLNVFSSGLARLIVSTSHIMFITCHNCLCFFYTPINCEVHGKRMVSFSERSPQRLVHGRCQRALSERMKEQTDEGRMNACV